MNMGHTDNSEAGTATPVAPEKTDEVATEVTTDTPEEVTPLETPEA